MNTFPLTYEIQRQEEYSRFMPLIKWLLAFPHYVVLVFLGLAALFVLLISFFAVLFTGRYPRSFFGFLVGVGRWAVRVAAYVLLMTDRYPPFTLDDDPDYPVRYDVAYPEEGINHWRPLVHWILVFPYHVIAGILSNLALTVSFFALFTILFTKRYPPGMFDLALNGLRWGARANVYAAWMTNTYPPFEWEPQQPTPPTAATAVQPAAEEPPAAPTA